MVKKTFFIITILFSVIFFSYAQTTENHKLRLDKIVPNLSTSGNLSELRSFELQRDSIPDENVKYSGSKKSPGLAMLYSLFVPGTGQLYSHRFDVGRYYMVSEAALWLGFVSFTIYGNWLLNDAHKFAAIHAGINPNGKDDTYFVNISNYDNIYEYNNDQLSSGNYNNLYDQNTYYFYWDNSVNREQYRTDQLAGDRMITDRIFFVGAIIVNHIISAISAVILTNSYNDKLAGSNGGFAINADVVRNGIRANGLKLKFTKWF